MDALQPVIDALAFPHRYAGPGGTSGAALAAMPTQDAVRRLTDDCRRLLFPFHAGAGSEAMPAFVAELARRIHHDLQALIQKAICLADEVDGRSAANAGARAAAVAMQFMHRLPELREWAQGDVTAAYHGDPALRYIDEAVLCYPGILALVHQRLAHELYRLDVPLLPRMMTERAHTLTGIDIHPGATIGPGLFIDHGTGVVVGETAIIGRNVRIYQGVTLGAKSFPLDEKGHPIKGVPRHPIVDDDVIIYAGASILGRVTIGKGAVIGSNVSVMHDVPAGGKVLQAQSRVQSFGDGGGI